MEIMISKRITTLLTLVDGENGDAFILTLIDGFENTYEVKKFVHQRKPLQRNCYSVLQTTIRR